MPKCQFTKGYFDYESRKVVYFNCDEEEEDPLDSGLCIFHHNNYCLLDKTNHEKHQRAVRDRLKHKVNHAISNNERLLCIGFQLHDFNLSDLSNSKEFTRSVYFNHSEFFGEANFREAKFEGMVYFSGANFQGEAAFSNACFQGRADFNKAEFNNKAYFSEASFKYD